MNIAYEMTQCKLPVAVVYTKSNNLFP